MSISAGKNKDGQKELDEKIFDDTQSISKNLVDIGEQDCGIKLTRNGDTVAVIYFDNLGTTTTSIKIGVIQAHIVMDRKPLLVHVY